MKRHLETCNAATELALSAFHAAIDLQNEILALVETLRSISESAHAALAAGPGWPAPAPEQVAALRSTIAQLGSELSSAVRALADLRAQVDGLLADSDP